jgi:hypothetical protein
MDGAQRAPIDPVEGKETTMLERLMIAIALSAGLALGACGGAEVTADDDPGEEPADFKMGTEADFTEGDFGTDIDISEGDEYEPED